MPNPIPITDQNKEGPMKQQDHDVLQSMREHMEALRREICRLRTLWAKWEAEDRLARGEDGFDG